MAMIRKSILWLSILPSVSFAFFCPNNFKQIQAGDSPDQVQTQCGKPDKQDKSTDSPLVPQEWNYYVAQTIAPGTPQDQSGTLKTTIAFDDKGKAVNINVNGIGLGGTTICGPLIQLGNTQEQIKKACGEPNFIYKQEPNNPAGGGAQPVEVITYYYGSTKLVFRDGKLQQ